MAPSSLSTSAAASPKLSSDDDDRLQAILRSALPFLRGELEKVDPALPSLVAVLRSVGAGECWHKHGSFLDHLVDIYRIMKLWKCPDAACLCGLFHSAYSNSYVNLAIFHPSTGREVVRSHVGDAAERLIHLFCVVPRQPLIHDDLLFKYSDEELADHLRESAAANEGRSEGRWREKVRSLVPADGVVVKHIKSGEDVRVSRRVVALFLMMTMADFSDQLFGFQDEVFDNDDGRNTFTALWPGNGKPGLWLNSISRMGGIYTLLLREEELFIQERLRARGIQVDPSRDEDLDLVTPPVFDNCTKILDPQDQIHARGSYWEAVSNSKDITLDRAEELLLTSIRKNPFVGEPYVVLGQVYLSRGLYEEGQKAAETGLRMLLEWGSPWDKRMSWEGWVAWARVLVMKANDKSWPNTSWGILNLGLVK
ncbi:hypothetical protein V2J09_001671 [Rumex salicifolius]